MQLTPGEKAVLRQVGALYRNETKSDHPLNALMSQWVPTHYETYKTAYRALVAKSLIQDVDAQFFRLTEAGLAMLGLSLPAVQPAVAPQPRPASPRAVTPASSREKPKRGALSRLWSRVSSK